jgi:hypothetical protein
MRPAKPLVVGLAVAFLTSGIALSMTGSDTKRSASDKAIRLDAATIIVEVNATEGDAGIQFFLDGEPWKSMKVKGPKGSGLNKMVQIDTKGRLKRHGLTELFSESSEPPFEELPLDEFKRRFPEGKYKFSGRTIEGKRLIGSAKLSHDIPNGPQINSPSEGDVVDPVNTVLSWNAGPQPPGVEIVAYRAILEREDPLRVFSVDLPASVNSLTVSEEFLEPGTEYLFELQAIEASGNITFSEVHFSVG